MHAPRQCARTNDSGTDGGFGLVMCNSTMDPTAVSIDRIFGRSKSRRNCFRVGHRAKAVAVAPRDARHEATASRGASQASKDSGRREHDLDIVMRADEVLTVKSKVARKPDEPSKERKLHEATRCPFRDRCGQHCVDMCGTNYSTPRSPCGEMRLVQRHRA